MALGSTAPRGSVAADLGYPVFLKFWGWGLGISFGFRVLGFRGLGLSLGFRV